MTAPDTWLIESKARLSWGALVAGGIGILVLILGNRYTWAQSLQTPAIILVAAAVLGWIIVVNRATPKVSDYLAHLKLEAEKEGLGEWLAGTDIVFMEAWGLRRLEELGHE